MNDMGRKERSTRSKGGNRKTVGDVFRDISQFFLQTDVVDLASVIMYFAIAITFGLAFSRVLNSLIEDIVFPLLNPMIGNMLLDWQAIKIGPDIAIGNFLSTLLRFVIISTILFTVVRFLKRMRKY
jgi:large conductance mechanosensitive channel